MPTATNTSRNCLTPPPPPQRTPPSWLARIYCAPIGCMAQPRALARPPPSWPPKCCSRPRGLVISKDWTTGPASRLVMPCVSQQAGSRRGPSWQAASSHTWLNRDNGGGSSGPASFPLAEPQAHECPEAPAANSPPGRQPEGAQGTSREGSSEGPRKVPHPTSPTTMHFQGREPPSTHSSQLSRAPRGCVTTSHPL